MRERSKDTKFIGRRAENIVRFVEEGAKYSKLSCGAVKYSKLSG